MDRYERSRRDDDRAEAPRGRGDDYGSRTEEAGSGLARAFFQQDDEHRRRTAYNPRYDYERGERGSYDRSDDGRSDYGRRGGHDDDRGFFERAGDEVRSWFGGDDDRRRSDRYEDGGYGRPAYGRSEFGRPDYGRSEYGREGYDQGFRREGLGRSSGYGAQTGWSGQGSYGGMTGGASGYGGSYGSSDYGRSGFGGGQGMRGRGPQGYTRSNERIQDDVCEALTDSDYVDATNIQVRCENGEVILEGTVRSRQEKRAAEDAVERVRGVRDVHNRLRVQQEGEEYAASGTGSAGASAGANGGAEPPSGSRSTPRAAS